MPSDLARWVVFGTVFFIYHCGCLLARDGRTLGKTAADICVISSTGQSLTASRSLLRAGVRSAPFILLGVPSMELVGGTLLLAFVLAEFYFLEKSPSRHTVADFVAHSLVVNVPPLQPHRAPAGPMFSANDRELGSPPRRLPSNDHSNSSRSNLAHGLESGNPGLP